jgi:ABC-2 type transport system ATP-binding protein
MSLLIEARDLTRSYGKRRGIVDVDFEVREGEAFGFLGPNGAGKTTTIRVLLGFIKPTSGHVAVFGRDPWKDAPEVHRKLSYLGSDPGYLGELTAAEQLDYLGSLRGLGKGAWRPLAERLDLDPHVRIRRLSRGNRQKVAVVQAFMGNEPLLVMDEPSSGLDPLLQREFLALVAEARAQGRTVFLSSHNLVEVERACDRVGIIREGRIVDVAAVGELLGAHWRSVDLALDAPARREDFDLPNVEIAALTGREVHLMVRGDINPLLAAIARHDVRDISITTPDVEDLFLHYYEDRTPGNGIALDHGPGGDGVRSEDRRVSTGEPVPAGEARE